MPVFMLSNEIAFPPANFAREDGLICVGGDLSPERLINAYSNGIFPWFSKGDPILWWSPDPRLILYPGKVHISRSLRKKINNSTFQVTADKAFESVIEACARFRGTKRTSTWLVDGMIEAYVELHRLGYAHSFESWKDGRLAGGLYGIALGSAFFGESMFSHITDASKVALAALSDHLKLNNFEIIDCQVSSEHLLSMGAEEIPRKKFLKILRNAIEGSSKRGKWEFDGFSAAKELLRLNKIIDR